MEDYSMFVPNVHFEQIPIKNLVSNQEYQRNISEQHVLNAAAHFDLYQINPCEGEPSKWGQLCLQWPAHGGDRRPGLWLS